MLKGLTDKIIAKAVVSLHTSHEINMKSALFIVNSFVYVLTVGVTGEAPLPYGFVRTTHSHGERTFAVLKRSCWTRYLCKLMCN